MTEREFRRHFGERLRKLRDQKGLTQVGMATALKLESGSTTVSRWERGEVFPRPAHLVALANLLDISPQELLGPFFTPEIAALEAVG